jgi:hypothetical protein
VVQLALVRLPTDATLLALAVTALEQCERQATRACGAAHLLLAQGCAAQQPQQAREHLELAGRLYPECLQTPEALALRARLDPPPQETAAAPAPAAAV